MAVSCLSTYPLVILGIIEPLLLVWAYITGIRDPQQFYLDQVPTSSNGAAAVAEVAAVPPQGLVLTLALVNVYLLLAALAVVCCFTPHAPVTRGYLLAVALADYGHIYATYAGVGSEVFWDPSRWNDMIWGSVGVSVFLNVHRLLALLGVFGHLASAGSNPGPASLGKKKA
ncbi:hypothetical protein SLS62_003781 [Diatrype stigma]|uniref:DUF7704 domain-containing protein n=1 Tax=Diatrype stigma TaxID=117547 RepID=A0AAN9YTZ6_9PEZI